MSLRTLFCGDCEDYSRNGCLRFGFKVWKSGRACNFLIPAILNNREKLTQQQRDYPIKNREKLAQQQRDRLSRVNQALNTAMESLKEGLA